MESHVSSRDITASQSTSFDVALITPAAAGTLPSVESPTVRAFLFMHTFRRHLLFMALKLPLQTCHAQDEAVAVWVKHIT